MAPSASFLQSKEQYPNLAATTITGRVQVRLHQCPAHLLVIRLRFHQTGTCRMYNLQLSQARSEGLYELRRGFIEKYSPFYRISCAMNNYRIHPRLQYIPQEADINRAVHGTAADGTVRQHKKRKKEATRPNPIASQIHRPVSGFASGLSGDREHPAPAHPPKGTKLSLSAAPQPSIK